MRGLRKPEGNDFERFFSVVQNAAEKTGAVLDYIYVDKKTGHFPEEELKKTPGSED